MKEAILLHGNALRELRGLAAPEARRERFVRFLSAQGEALDLARQARAALRQNDPVGVVRAGGEVSSVALEADALARRLGLDACELVLVGPLALQATAIGEQ